VEGIRLILEGMEFKYEQYKGEFLRFVKIHFITVYRKAVLDFIGNKTGPWPVCSQMYIHIHIHTHKHTHTYTHTHKHAHASTHARARTRTHAHAHTHTA